MILHVVAELEGLAAVVATEGTVLLWRPGDTQSGREEGKIQTAGNVMVPVPTAGGGGGGRPGSRWIDNHHLGGRRMD